jgi:hypothetical protein
MIDNMQEYGRISSVGKLNKRSKYMNGFKRLLTSIIVKKGYKSRSYANNLLSWNVSCPFEVLPLKKLVATDTFKNHFNFTVETKKQKKIFKLAVKLAKREWDVDEVWNTVTEDMANGVRGQYAADSYYFLSPQVAQKYGVSHDDKLDATFEFHGRGGKHLCLTQFEGFDLTLDRWDFDYRLQGYDSGYRYTNKTIRLLCAYIEECDRMFTEENIKEEFEHNCAFLACKDVENQWAEAKALYAKKKLKKAVRKASKFHSSAEIAKISVQASL